MEMIQRQNVFDMFTGDPVKLQGPGFVNQDMAERIIQKLRRLERLDEYALDATDIYLSGMLDVLDR